MQQAVDAHGTQTDSDQFRQRVGQAPSRPQRERQIQRAWPLANHAQRLLTVFGCHCGRSTGPGSIRQALNSLGDVTGQPAANRFLVVPHQYGNLGHLPLLLCRQQDDQGSNAEMALPRTGQVIKFLKLFGRWGRQPKGCISTSSVRREPHRTPRTTSGGVLGDHTLQLNL